MSDATTWMLSSGGRRGALLQLLKDTPRGSRCVVTDASPLSAAGWMADAFKLVPPVRNPDFVEETLEFAVAQGVTRIVPTIDPELPVFAENRRLFEQQGIDVLVSTPEVVALSSDKWLFAQWLEAEGLPAPRTVEYKEGWKVALDGPLVAKPRGGSSSKGVRTFVSRDQLATASLTPDYIVQEAATGTEVTVDFAVDRSGAFLGAVPRVRLEVRAGEVSKGVTRNIPKVEELTRSFAEALPGAFGVLNVQMFYDFERDEASLIELNARVGGGFPLSAAAGANFFESFSEGSPEPADYIWERDLTMLRYDQAVFVPGALLEADV